VSAPLWPVAPPARLLALAAEIPPGPWDYRRALDGSGALIVWDSVDALAEPLALLYRGGVDLAKYLRLVSPAYLLGMGA
jgi:hypothetical protein